MYSVAKKFEFEASHKLVLNYESPCQNIHGHSYKVMIEISSDELNVDGMVIDFSELKSIKEWVMDNWDHALIVSKDDPSFNELNNLNCAKIYRFEWTNVTAELMARMIFDQIRNTISNKINRVKRISVKIWETSSNRAKYSRDFE